MNNTVLKKNFLLIIFLFLCSSAFSIPISDETIYLWHKIPSMKKENTILFVHTVKNVKNTGIAVIICPGGSYHHLDLSREGWNSAKWFAEQGITAFMLKYRTNQDGYHHPAMLEDVQRAIQYVRENADRWGVDKNKVGVIGYSAGGHLATMSGVYSDENHLSDKGIDTKESLRPDFVIPVYPVVSMSKDITHEWSKKSLLGKNPSEEDLLKFSMELNIPDDMPPAFIVVAKDDRIVDYRNSVVLYDAIKQNNIPHSYLTIYDWGDHGFGMKENDFMNTFHWNEKILPWLDEIFLEAQFTEER